MLLWMKVKAIVLMSTILQKKFISTSTRAVLLWFHLSSLIVVHIYPVNKSIFPHFQLAPSSLIYAKRNSGPVYSLKAFPRIPGLLKIKFGKGGWLVIKKKL